MILRESPGIIFEYDRLKSLPTQNMGGHIIKNITPHIKIERKHLSDVIMTPRLKIKIPLEIVVIAQKIRLRVPVNTSRYPPAKINSSHLRIKS